VDECKPLLVGLGDVQESFAARVFEPGRPARSVTLGAGADHVPGFLQVGSLLVLVVVAVFDVTEAAMLVAADDGLVVHVLDHGGGGGRGRGEARDCDVCRGGPEGPVGPGSGSIEPYAR